jgi:uncharacterized integral membrane protein
MSEQEREQEQEHDAQLAAKVRRRQTLRVGILVVLGVICAAVALDNTDNVALGWVFGEVEVPLIAALVASFVLGVLLGVLGRRRRK